MFDLYSEIILDHHKNPQNKQRIDKPSISQSEYNPLCGDKLDVDLNIEDNTITKIGWGGEGCAISQAAMSMISEELIGKDINEVKALDNKFIYDLLMVPISPARIKCALLGLAAIKKAIIYYQASNE